MKSEVLYWVVLCIKQRVITKNIFICFILFLGSSVLISCMERSKSPEGDGTRFSITTSNVEVSDGELIKTSEGVEVGVQKNKLLSFKVCLQNNIGVGRQHLNQEQRFNILKQVKTQSIVVASKVTDSQGCLHWQEKLPYNAFADSTCVYIDRWIEGVGALRGLATVSVGVNPWATARNESTRVVDVSKGEQCQKFSPAHAENDALSGIFQKRTAKQQSSMSTESAPTESAPTESAAISSDVKVNVDSNGGLYFPKGVTTTIVRLNQLNNRLFVKLRHSYHKGFHLFF